MAPLPDHLSPKPHGVEPLPAAVRKEHQRDRVLAAAARVFARRGYRQTSVDDIVSAAKIGVGGFYELFGGKEAALLAVVERALEQAAQGIVAAGAAQRSWAGQVRAGLEVLLSQFAAEPDAAHAVFLDAPAAGGEPQARYEEALRDAVAFLRRGRALEPAGELPDSVELGLLAGAAGLVGERIEAGRAGELQRLFPDLAAFVLGPYLDEAELDRVLAGRSEPQGG